jgi:hypothetical protein
MLDMPVEHQILAILVDLTQVVAVVVPVVVVEMVLELIQDQMLEELEV